MEEKLIKSIIVAVAVLAMLDLLGVSGTDMFGAIRRLTTGPHGRIVSILVLGLVGYTVYRIIQFTTRP